MKNNIKMGLGILTVLAVPFTLDATVGANEAQAAQGWVQSGSTWYYYNTQGQPVKNAWIGNYWLGADGKMAVNSWVDGGKYYVGSNGVWDKNAQKPAPKMGWQHNGTAWYYYNTLGQPVKNAWIGDYWLGADGKMAVNSWVDGGKYYVGSNGVWDKNAQKPAPKMGWQHNGTAWYYYNTQGQPVKNAWIGDYWLGADGKMAVNSWVDGGKYYVGSNGVWDKNAQKPEEKKTGWVQSGSTWYYYNTQGQPVKNAWIGNYWLGADGKMAVNSWVDGGKYYVGSNGAWDKNAQKPEEKKTGWIQSGSAWYYYNTQGQPVKNAWIGDYWLGADGKMAVNSWVDGGKYYVGSNGAWDKNAQKPEEKKTGWIQSGSAWYYYNTQGQPVKNAWIGNYWLGADGKMAVNSWVDNGRYYVDSSGAWVQNKGNSSTKNTSLDSILNIARNYLGVQSGSDEHKKIVDAYNSVNPKPVGYTAKYSDDWCDIFVTTVFQQAGLSDLIGRECGVQRHINIMEKKGIWKGKTLPKVGDVITFDWDGGGFADHIGIVESVNNGIVTTIEGNSSNYAGSTEETRVNRKTYNWNASYIKGYARPIY